MHHCARNFITYIKMTPHQNAEKLREANETNSQNVLRNYQIRRKILYSNFIGLDQTEIDSACVEKLVVEIHKMLQGTRKTKPKEAWGQSASMILLRNCIEKEMFQLGRNAFGLFKGVTWYTSHEMRGANSPYASPEGTAHRINQKAFQYCMHLKTTSQVKRLQAV